MCGCVSLYSEGVYRFAVNTSCTAMCADTDTYCVPFSSDSHVSLSVLQLVAVIVHTGSFTCVCACVCAGVYVHVCVHVYVFVCICVCMCVHR